MDREQADGRDMVSINVVGFDVITVAFIKITVLSAV
jgi:hypothetical protein